MYPLHRLGREVHIKWKVIKGCVYFWLFHVIYGYLPIQRFKEVTNIYLWTHMYPIKEQLGLVVIKWMRVIF